MWMRPSVQDSQPEAMDGLPLVGGLRGGSPFGDSPVVHACFFHCRHVLGYSGRTKEIEPDPPKFSSLREHIAPQLKLSDGGRRSTLGRVLCELPLDSGPDQTVHQSGEVSESS